MGACCGSTKVLIENKQNKSEETKKILHEQNISENKNEEKQEEIKKNDEIKDEAKLNPKKVRNYSNYFKNITNSTIIKEFNEVNGEQVIIESCSDSVIIIKDITAQVTIEKSNNCNILIGACKSSISLRNSENINIISASQQFLCRNCSNCNVSLFTLTNPNFEDCKSINLFCYNFNKFSKIKELFSNAELDIWENKWSEYSVFSTNSEIKFSDNQEIFSKLFENLQNENVNTEYIPYTFGLSFDYMMFTNCLFFFDGKQFDASFSSLISKENLINEECNLIKTSRYDNESLSVLNDLKSYLGKEFEDFIKNRQEIICLWISSKTNNFSVVYSLKDSYINSFMITDNEKSLINSIKKLYDSFDFKEKPSF